MPSKVTKRSLTDKAIFLMEAIEYIQNKQPNIPHIKHQMVENELYLKKHKKLGTTDEILDGHRRIRLYLQRKLEKAMKKTREMKKEIKQKIAQAELIILRINNGSYSKSHFPEETASVMIGLKLKKRLKKVRAKRTQKKGRKTIQKGKKQEANLEKSDIQQNNKEISQVQGEIKQVKKELRRIQSTKKSRIRQLTKRLHQLRKQSKQYEKNIKRIKKSNQHMVLKVMNQSKIHPKLSGLAIQHLNTFLSQAHPLAQQKSDLNILKKKVFYDLIHQYSTLAIDKLKMTHHHGNLGFILPAEIQAKHIDQMFNLVAKDIHYELKDTWSASPLLLQAWQESHNELKNELSCKPRSFNSGSRSKRRRLKAWKSF